ncbi:MAG TPA: formylglycine-generating enzyme family protein, partial [Candidatus Cloacimonadota bacterium]|nr:formylglycine-generating enzyme family protein [Candidatus Cloacimonadota bacterium]
TYWNAITMNMSADGYRLPTEMEWEFAARGGNQSQNFTYSGSNTIEYVAWLYDNSSNMTRVVGSKAPNELGIFDMSGNVFEWCWDWIATYPSGSYTNPTTTISPYYRTKRGGSWDVDESYCQVSNRCDGNIDDRYSNNGFRVVRRIQ